MMEAVKTSTVKSKKPKTSRVKKAKENRNLKQKKKKKTLFAAVTTLGLKSAKVIHLKEIYAAGSDGKYNIRATSKIIKSSANGHKKILVIREDGLEKQVHIHGTSHDVQALQDAFISKTGENKERLNIGMKSLEELTEKIDNTVETNPETNDFNAADTTLGEQINRASDVGEDISTGRKFPGVIIEEIVDVPGFFPDNLTMIPSNNEEPVDFSSLMVQEGTLSRKIEDEESEENLNKELEAFAAYTQAMHSSPQSQEMDTFSKVNEILESSAGELNGLRNPEAEDANHETEEESQYPETKPILGIDGIPGSSTIAMNGLGTPDADKEEEETKYQGKPRIIENKKIESDNEEYATILQTLQTAKRMASSRQNFQKKTKENDENGNKVTPNPSANQFSSFQQSSGLNCTVVLKHEYQPHEPVTPFKESQYIEETADLKSDYSDNAPKLQNTLSPTSNSQFDPQDGATASDVMKMVVDEENEKKIQRHHINAPPLNSDVGTQTQPDDINDDSMDASSSSPTRKYRRNSLFKNNHISSHESSSSERSDTSSSDESNESEITDSEKIARLIKLNDSLLEHNSELIEQNTRLMTVFSSLKKPTGKAKDGKQSSSPDVQKQRKLVKKPEDLDDETMEILLNKSSMYLRTLHLVRLFWTEEELPHLYIKFPDPKKDTDVLVSNEEVTAIKKILQKVTEQKNIEKHTIENGWRDKVRASIGRQLSILRYHEKKKLESKDE